MSVQSVKMPSEDRLPPLPDALADLSGAWAPCVGCAYDRRGLEPGALCPECGAPPPPERAVVVRSAPARKPGALLLQLAGAVILAAAAVGMSRTPTPGPGGAIATLLTQMAFAAAAIALVGSVAWNLWGGGSPKGSAMYVFSAGGISEVGGGRTSWRDVHAIRARNGVLKVRLRLNELVLRPGLSQEQTSALLTYLDGLRAAAQRTPAASPETGSVIACAPCPVCGAARWKSEDARSCVLCGAALPPGLGRVVTGRTSPHAMRRWMTRAYVPLGVMSAGFLLVVPSLLTGWPFSFQGRAWMMLLGPVAPAPFAAVIIWKETQRRRRIGRDYRDSTWVIRDDRLEVHRGARMCSAPWRRIHGIATGATVDGWTELRLNVSGPLRLPPTLWFDSQREDLANLVNDVQARCQPTRAQGA